MTPRHEERLPRPGEALRQRREALTARLLEAALASAELQAVALGVSLGLYDALREAGALTADALARVTGHDVAGLADWLAQQASAGILHADDADVGSSPRGRRYALPHGHDEVLAEHDNPACLADFLAQVADARSLRETARFARRLQASAA